MNFIKNQDTISSPGCRLFHLNGDIKHKSYLGGMASIIIYAIVLYVAVTKGFELYGE